MKHSTESIWNMFCCKLKPFVMQWISDAQSADDIIQEVFIKVHERAHTIKDETKIRAWVLQITRNTVFDCLRKKKIAFDTSVLSELPDENGNFVVSNTNERDLHNEIVSGLEALIQSLPEKYAQALQVVEYVGLSQVELAEKLKLSPSGAKSRVQRARQMVKDILMQCCHYEFDKYGTVIGIKPEDCCCCK